MNSGRTVFSQLMDYLPTYEFQKCVNRYSGDYRSRSLSCRDQFLAMAFAQLTYSESLRDIETCLGSVGSKLYHMDFRSTIARSTLPMPTSLGTGGSSRLCPDSDRDGTPVISLLATVARWRTAGSGG